MLVGKVVFEEGGIARELILGWMAVGSFDRGRYEGVGMEVVETHRLMCDRSMGGEGLRR